MHVAPNREVPVTTHARSRTSRWLLLFAGWSVFGLVQSAMWTALDRTESTSMAVISVFAFYLPLSWIWALLTPVVGWLSRAVRNRYSSLFVRFLAHVPFVVLAGILHTFARRALATKLGYPPTFPFGVPLLYYADLTIASYLAAMWASRALEAQDALLDRTAKAQALEAQLTTAQMEYLQLQLRPHFLFNTLSSVAELGHEAPASAARMLRNVIVLLQSALARHGPSLVSLGEELETLSHYLAIERLRFADWLVIEEEVDDAARDALVPPFVLQPLVENSVHHGLVDRTARGRITIRAGITANRLRISVVDNGVGLSRASYGASRGIGLRNVRERLEALYGSDAELTLKELDGEGTAASVEIPMEFAPKTETDGASECDHAQVDEPKQELNAEADYPREQRWMRWARHHPVATPTLIWIGVALLRIQHSYVYMLYRNRYSAANFRGAIRYDVTAAAVWLLLTPLVFALARAVPLRRDRLVLRIAGHAASASIIAFVHLAATRILTQTFDIPLLSAPSSEVYAWSVSVYAFILVIAHIREVETWIRDREMQALRLEGELADAKIQRVMLELRPNVLLDALRHLEITIGNDPVRAEKSLADIGEFLRLTLDGMYYREIRVRDECASVRAYARVLAIATCPELTLDLQAEPDALEQGVPNGVLRAALESILDYSDNPVAVKMDLSAEKGSIIVTGTRLLPDKSRQSNPVDLAPLFAYTKQGFIRTSELDHDRVRIVIESNTISPESFSRIAIPLSTPSHAYSTV
jgi:two-component system LytT family sensor kinase